MRRSPYAIRANAPALVDGVPLAAGETRTVSLPVAVEVEGVRLSWAAERSGSGVPMRLGVLALAMVAAASLVWSLPDETGAPAAVAAIAPEPATVAATPAAPTMNAAAGELTRLAEQAGLAVTVDGGPRQVTARGTIAPDQEAAWRRVQVAFDARFGTAVPLVNLVTIETPAPPSLPPIEAVWQGDGPYVVVRGQKYHIGTAIGGEWQVTEIRPDAVTLHHTAAGVVTIRF